MAAKHSFMNPDLNVCAPAGGGGGELLAGAPGERSRS